MKRWPIKKAHFWETAPFFRILLPFAAGILCYDQNWLSPIKGEYLIAAICVAFIAYAIVATRMKSNSSTNLAAFLLLFITLFAGGAAVSYYDDIRNDKAWFGNSIDAEHGYLVRVSDVPTEKEHTWKVPVSMISNIQVNKVIPVTGKALLYVYKDNNSHAVHKGDTLLAPGDWQPIKNAGNPFEFDYVTWCRRSGIHYGQFCASEDIRLYAADNATGASFTAITYDWCMQQLDKYIPDPKAKGLIQAMILGNETNLDENIRQSYADTGIIHIIAISGGNVAIFFIVISALLWWLRHRKHLWVKYTIALPLVWFYVLMAGAAPSAIRAAVMFTLLAGTVLFDKSNNSLNQLFVTAFLLLCAQPAWLFSVGFQLSFVAVLSLILFYTPVYGWLSPVHRPLRLLWGTVAASIAAELLVAPLVIYYFHTFPLLFIVANAAAYLFMSVVLIMGIAVIALSFIPIIAKGLGVCIVFIVTWFDYAVTYLQGLSPRSFHFLVLTGFELFLAYIMLGGIIAFLIKPRKPALLVGLGTAFMLLCSLCASEWVHLHQQRFVVYNTTRSVRTEFINGSTYKITGVDTSTDKKTERTLNPAHTNWQVWERDTAAANEVFELAGKKILVLNHEINTRGHFPVDIVVINYTGHTDLSNLQSIFTPERIVIGNNYTEEKQEQLVSEGRSKGLSVHAVAINGAFVLQ